MKWIWTKKVEVNEPNGKTMFVVHGLRSDGIMFAAWSEDGYNTALEMLSGWLSAPRRLKRHQVSDYLRYKRYRAFAKRINKKAAA